VSNVTDRNSWEFVAQPRAFTAQAAAEYMRSLASGTPWPNSWALRPAAGDQPLMHVGQLTQLDGVRMEQLGTGQLRTRPRSGR
jgi:hypothetical protein